MSLVNDILKLYIINLVSGYFNLKESRAKQIEKSEIKNIRKHFEPQWNYICNYTPSNLEEKEWLIVF